MDEDDGYKCRSIRYVIKIGAQDHLGFNTAAGSSESYEAISVRQGESIYVQGGAEGTERMGKGSASPSPTTCHIT